MQRMSMPSFSFSSMQLEKALKSAIFRATVDKGTGQVDAIALDEINRILKTRPDFMKRTVDLIKARIKDRIASTSCVALKLLAEIMHSNGIELHLYVAKKVLNRVLRLATPNMGIHPHVQTVAATLIKHWGSTLGTDARLPDFADAARCASTPANSAQST